MLLLFRLQHELEEKDKVLETLELRLQSKGEMQSVALSPISFKSSASPSASRRYVETQTSPGLHAKSPLHVSLPFDPRQPSIRVLRQGT